MTFSGKIRTYVADGMMTDDPWHLRQQGGGRSAGGCKRFCDTSAKNGFEHHVAMNAPHRQQFSLKPLRPTWDGIVYWHRE
jgi:hypothetical protein